MKTKMRKAYALRCGIFEDKLIGNCSNHGISARFPEILLLCDEGNVEVDLDNPPANLCKVVRQELPWGTNVYVEPVAKRDPGCVGWMFGGTLIYSSDLRFDKMSDGFPLRLHDRQEGQDQGGY